MSLHRADYVRAPKIQKPSVARVIVRAIRNGDPPGRFLRKNDKTGKWEDIGDKKAAEKTSQALREKTGDERRAKVTGDVTGVGMVGAAAMGVGLLPTAGVASFLGAATVPVLTPAPVAAAANPTVQDVDKPEESAKEAEAPGKQEAVSADATQEADAGETGNETQTTEAAVADAEKLAEDAAAAAAAAAAAEEEEKVKSEQAAAAEEVVGNVLETADV